MLSGRHLGIKCLAGKIRVYLGITVKCLGEDDAGIPASKAFSALGNSFVQLWLGTQLGDPSRIMVRMQKT